jgi:hypothetical protein
MHSAQMTWDGNDDLIEVPTHFQQAKFGAFLDEQNPSILTSDLVMRSLGSNRRAEGQSILLHPAPWTTDLTAH